MKVSSLQRFSERQKGGHYLIFINLIYLRVMLNKPSYISEYDS